jgi:hypothetical protein
MTELDDFMNSKTWVETSDGIRQREQADRALMWIVIHPVDSYQPVANRNWETARFFESRRFKNLEEAKKYAWDCRTQFLKGLPPEDPSPANVSMDLF